MTLKEAHERLRKEVLALRRENEKLKAGTYTDAYENEIRRLKSALAAKEKECERYHQLWRDCVHNGGNHETQMELGNLRLQLQKANEVISKLKAQLNRNHENSSIPSSQKPFHKAIKNSREKTDRKPGAQKGHIGHKRSATPKDNIVVTNIPATDEMQKDPDLYPTGAYITRQLVDIQVNVVTTTYKAEIYRSRSTGKRVHAPFPSGMTNEINYGPNVKALAFLLNNYCNVSIDKTRELISGITSSEISLSSGFVNMLAARFSEKTEKVRADIYNRLLQAPAMYTDATAGRVNGKQVQVYVCANDSELLYFFRDHKGYEGLKGTPVEEYQQILIHDHDKTYYKYGGDHQECLAHVLRYLQDSIENEQKLTWNMRMKKFLSGVIHETKQNRNIPEARILEIEEEYDRILHTADLEYNANPPGKYYRDGYNLFCRLKEYKHNHLLFLRHPEIDYTNNLSERALRKFKRKFKQVVTFRSTESVEMLCNCLSILETGRLQGKSLFDVARNAYAL